MKPDCTITTADRETRRLNAESYLNRNCGPLTESQSPSRPDVRGSRVRPSRKIWAPLAAVLSASALLTASTDADGSSFELVDSTIPQMKSAMNSGLITSEMLVNMYFARINAYDKAGPKLNSYLSTNENAVVTAQLLDAFRSGKKPSAELLQAFGLTQKEFEETKKSINLKGPLYGIPMLLKDNVNTVDMPTTAGSVALAGSIPADDAFITKKLRAAGAIILGKGTMTEYANFLTSGMPAGYSSLGGYGFNPYYPVAQPGGDGRPILSPSGSSSGPGIAAAANLAAVCIGTETSGSIIGPATAEGLVGIKPTVGLVSRSGIVPISADQDTAGPLARTVQDAAIVLGVIAGYDPNDPATAACLIKGNSFSDYTKFLNNKALKGARIAVSQTSSAFISNAIVILQKEGADVVVIPRLTNVVTPSILNYGFKRDLNAYLAQLPAAWPRRTLADIIDFNNNTPGALKYGQTLATASQALDISPGSADTATYQSNLVAGYAESRGILDAVYNGPDGVRGTKDDFDALLNPGAGTPARAGYPSVTVSGGFLPGTTNIVNPQPSDLQFSGPAFSEPKLISLAYAFEQATKLRQPPASTPPLPSDLVHR
jgi:amidase